MRRHIFAALGIILIATAAHTQTTPSDAPPPLSMPSDRVDDSYAVYSSLIPLGETADKNWPHSLWLIRDTTVTAVADDHPCVSSEEDARKNLDMGMNPHHALQAPKDRAQDLQEALEDFDAHCHERVYLDPSAWRLDVPVRLLTPAEQNEFMISRSSFSKDPEKNAQLEALREKYKGAPGLYAFSQVYFNKAHTIALVYATQWCGGLCGEGYWVALAKNNADQWKQLNWTTSHWMS